MVNLALLEGTQFSHHHQWLSFEWHSKAQTTNCRVTRHLISTISRQHGSPAETKPDRTIHTQRGKNELHPSRPQTLFKSSET
jgi:hypothetical protein